MLLNFIRNRIYKTLDSKTKNQRSIKIWGLNLGLNSLVHCDTMCNNNNQSSFFSKELGASCCVVVFYCGGDLVTARNLEEGKMPDTEMCLAFVIY